MDPSFQLLRLFLQKFSHSLWILAFSLWFSSNTICVRDRDEWTRAHTVEAGSGDAGPAEAIRMRDRDEWTRAHTAEAGPGEGGTAGAVRARGRADWVRFETAGASAGGGGVREQDRRHYHPQPGRIACGHVHLLL